ncbi:MAG: carboxypeptidase regulatory-like domain-containing protein [Haloarculaceae archaeon]
MHRSLVRAVVLVVLVAAAAPALAGAATAQEQTTVTVTVVDQAGDPVGGVDLTVVWNDGEGSENVTTRANGQVLVDVPEGATVEVRVTDDEYLRNRPAVFFGVDGGELRVEASLPGTARVTVTDSAGPVEGATARLAGQGITRTVDTGADGVATLGPVERGSYGLRVSEPGYLTNSSDIELTGEVNRTVRLREADRQLSVRVVDDYFDPPRPLSGATVEIEGVATLTTGNNGQRGTTVAVNTDYEVTATADGYEAVTRAVSVDESDASVTLAIQREDAISVETTSDRVVLGESTRLTVTDEYGEPVVGATVNVNGTEVGQTDDRGVYDLTVDSAGNRTVTVSTDGLSTSVTIEGVDPAGQEMPTDTATTRAPTTDAPTAATPTETDTAPGGITPGFGAVAGVVALAMVVALALARARDA